MGTSSSNPGTNNKSPLVPSWADPQAPPTPPPPPGRFGPFRTSLGNWGKSGNSNSLRNALGSYTRQGYGGSANAASRISATARAGGALQELLSEIAGGGDGSASTGQSLGNFAGINVDEFIDIIVDTISPNIGTVDDELLRLGLDHALAVCLQDVEVFDPISLTPDMLVRLYVEFISEEVTLRIISDSKGAFNRSPNPVQMENDLRHFVRATVDNCAGPKLEGGIQVTDPAVFEQLILDSINEVFQIFEGF